jgi:polyhydroxybutyrate depolymerase
MKIIIYAAILLFFCEFLNSQTIDIDGVERSYLVHLPVNMTEGETVPLAIALHYLGVTSANFETYTKFSIKTDQEYFIVTYPLFID